MCPHGHSGRGPRPAGRKAAARSSPTAGGACGTAPVPQARSSGGYGHAPRSRARDARKDPRSRREGLKGARRARSTTRQDHEKRRKSTASFRSPPVSVTLHGSARPIDYSTAPGPQQAAGLYTSRRSLAGPLRPVAAEPLRGLSRRSRQVTAYHGVAGRSRRITAGPAGGEPRSPRDGQADTARRPREPRPSTVA